LERFTRSARLDPREANTAWLTCFTDEWKDFLYTPEFARRLRGAATARSLGRWYEGSGDPLDDVFYADLSQPLADGLLYKVDIAAMASALEVRSPFLEQGLVRFAMALPPSRKTGFKTGKKLLRAAYAGLLPDATLRARKAGFGLPVDRWLRGPLRALSHDTLLAGRAVTRGYLRAGAVAELLRAHDSGEANHDDRIWALLCLELWIRGVVEAGASAVDGVQATGATTAGIREARR
jgi:asparagine synthase (glutamine-hydrolysing)